MHYICIEKYKFHVTNSEKRQTHLRAEQALASSVLKKTGWAYCIFIVTNFQMHLINFCKMSWSLQKRIGSRYFLHSHLISWNMQEFQIDDTPTRSTIQTYTIYLHRQVFPNLEGKGGQKSLISEQVGIRKSASLPSFRFVQHRGEPKHKTSMPS